MHTPAHTHIFILHHIHYFGKSTRRKLSSSTGLASITYHANGPSFLPFPPHHSHQKSMQHNPPTQPSISHANSDSSPSIIIHYPPLPQALSTISVAHPSPILIRIESFIFTPPTWSNHRMTESIDPSIN